MRALGGAWRGRQASVIPGFGLAIGVTLAYLGLIVLVPLAGLFLKSAELTADEFAAILSDPRSLSALKVSFVSAFVAALINAPFGLVIAWVLTRYRFPARRILDAAIDLPFALPTAVAGITLATIYGPKGAVGGALQTIGLQVAYAPPGIVVALIFVGLPFVVRTVQPVIAEIDREIEEAAAILGAGRARTFARVIFPILMPATLTGFALAFARAIGEYGSVIFIAGNIPFRSEIAPLLIVIRLEEFDYPAATAIALVMLAISFALLLFINLVQGWARARFGHVG